MSKRPSTDNLHSLNDWLSYYGNEHVSALGYGLSNITKVWQRIGKPVLAKKIISVAGTNGKGSTCEMLNLLLSAQGYKVGVYTSPHLLEYNERIKINNALASDAEIIAAFEQIEKAREDVDLSFFEATTLAAFILFSKSKLDFVILEVGLGGRLDATNIIDADAGIITSISYDHMSVLGHTLAEIAVEKAGIFRQGKIAIYAALNIEKSLLTYCKGNAIKLIRQGRHYQIIDKYLYLTDKRIEMPQTILMLGQHQIENAAGAIVLLHQLNALPQDAAVITATLENFHLLGRSQKILDKPCVIVDVAHNEDSAKKLAKYLANIKPNYKNIYAVVGMLKDKEHCAVFAQFVDIVDHYFLGDLEGERGFDAKSLQDKLQQVEQHNKADSFASIKQAYNAALLKAKDDDLIVVFGSFHTVCEVLK